MDAITVRQREIIFSNDDNDLFDKPCLRARHTGSENECIANEVDYGKNRVLLPKIALPNYVTWLAR